MDPVKRQRTATQSSTSIRGKLNERLARLTSKHNAEIELLEDLKQFSRQKSVLEKQYAEGLHRLVTQYVNKRDIRPPPDVPGFERHNNRGLLEIWRSLLEKTDELSKRRSTMSDLLNTQVSNVAKQQKRIKEANFKRLIEISQKMNSEILESAKELTTSKKSYSELEKVCEEARSKYTEAETKLKKKDLKLFETVSGLEKSYTKASDRLKSCQKRTTANRNDYLLAVEMTNAHLKRHSSRDFPQIMQAMDGEMYDKVRNAYSMYAQIEADMAIFVKAEFEDLAEQAYLLNREYVLECYLHNNPVLGELQEFKFEPYGQDTVTGMNREHGAEIFLDKDARKWANQLTKDQMSIATLQKQVKGLQSVTSAYTKTPEFGTSDAQAEALQKTDLLLEEIRQLEVQTTKAEARLEALREASIDVNKWLQKAEKSFGADKASISSANELTPNTSYSSMAPHGRVSQLSLPSSIGGSQDFDVETASVNSTHDDTVSLGSGRSEALPKFCAVLYDYNAQREDELQIVEGEELEVIEWDDGDGWCKGKNKSGQEGYFPQSYVKTISRPSSPTQGQGQGQGQGPSPAESSTRTPDVPPSAQPSVPAVPLPQATPVQSDTTKGKVMLKAVYDYTAQFDEELSFPEGALITLLRTDDNGVDDGWWEGSYQGKVGVFPSVVVETLGDESVSLSDLNVTLTSDPTSHPPPPPDSPPPLPPDYAPPPLSPMGANGMERYSYSSDMTTPVNFTAHSPLKKHVPAVKMDSFDSDSDFEMV